MTKSAINEAQQGLDRDPSRSGILVRSRDGIFYNLPIELAPKFVLDARQLREALDYYDNGESGSANLTGGWAKMSW